MVPKPPKPRDPEASPKGASLSKVKNALRALINRVGTESEAVDYFQEVLPGFGGMGVGAGGNRNDRGAALLLATNLEKSLQIAIERKSAIAKNIALVTLQQKSVWDMLWVSSAKRQRKIWISLG